MKKQFFIFNIILALLVLVGDAFYISYGHLWLKSITSAGFVLIGLINLVYAIISKKINLKYAIIMFIGLVFAMLGDILLEINFMIGAILFAIGHIFFFISYCFIARFKWTDLIAGGIIFTVAVLVLTLVPLFNFDTMMLLLCIFYALIISLMLGKAISNVIRERNLLNILMLVGSGLFFFSDLMLVFNVFTDIPGIALGLLCLITYYPAECILAHTILQADKKEKIEE
ncbi:MAG: lysoplasmalogenase [Clostridia bacterium]|nr:lysoplasmalogenase [Clostridia bacterium]